MIKIALRLYDSEGSCKRRKRTIKSPTIVKNLIKALAEANDKQAQEILEKEIGKKFHNENKTNYGYDTIADYEIEKRWW